MDIGTIIGVIGLVLAVYLGMRSIMQSHEMESMKRALRANNQAAFNNLWHIGVRASDLLKSEDLQVGKQLASEIEGISQAGRHWIVSLSKEQVLFQPYWEPAWEA